GFLTNFGEIKKKLRELQSLNTFIQKDSFKNLIKKEQVNYEKRRAELQSIYEGVVNLRDKPDVLFIIGLNKEKTACLEAKKAKIPIIAVCNNNCNPRLIDYVIPGNDESTKSIDFFASLVADAVIQAKGEAKMATENAAVNEKLEHILAIQEKYEVIIMIADLHALTIPNNELDYREKCYEIASLLYACGLKKENFLMAADIFLYAPSYIIVGQDQTQHLELVSDIARKFNVFCRTKLLETPNFEILSGGKIMSLKNPTKKMSKKNKKVEELEEAIRFKVYDYYDLKLDVINLIKKEIKSIREKYHRQPRNEIKELLKKNSRELRGIAEKKMKEIKERLKLLNNVNFLFDLLNSHIEKSGVIFDPCVGEGSLLNPWKNKGYRVQGVDIKKQGFEETIRQNYLKLEKDKNLKVSLVIMNPPFNVDETTASYIKKNYSGRPLLPEVWLKKTIELFGKSIPIVMFTPYGFRLNQSRESKR
ncbi:2352_t:CDS:2, partial [Cetraspora pellucida]